MYRREFLTTAASVGALGASCPVAAESAECHWCAAPTPKGSPLRDPGTDPSFTITGTRPIEVYWQPQSYFDDWGYPFARGGAIIGGNRIVLNRDRADSIDDYTILHELAHCLGYRHGDGGIVDTDTALYADTGDRRGTTLATPTRDVATSFDAYFLIERWTANVLGELVTAFGQGDIPAVQLGTAVTRYAGESRLEDIYIRHSFDGFGGQFPEGYRPDPQNVYAGQFYKGG